jgi:hypothetical protein
MEMDCCRAGLVVSEHSQEELDLVWQSLSVQI